MVEVQTHHADSLEHIFHNRLTHTLEVAQLARRLAEKLRDGQGELLAATLGTIEPEVAEAAALAHDLGQPPFGHIAESELNRIITEELGVRDGFEGNAQTFRVVTKLSIRHLDHPGQNLTRATLNAVLKYPWFRGRSGWKRKKYGAYSTERTDLHYARAIQPRAARLEKSAEAEIMDWADRHRLRRPRRGGLLPRWLHPAGSLDGCGRRRGLVKQALDSIRERRLLD